MRYIPFANSVRDTKYHKWCRVVWVVDHDLGVTWLALAIPRSYNSGSSPSPNLLSPLVGFKNIRPKTKETIGIYIEGDYTICKEPKLDA